MDGITDPDIIQECIENPMEQLAMNNSHALDMDDD